MVNCFVMRNVLPKLLTGQSHCIHDLNSVYSRQLVIGIIRKYSFDGLFTCHLIQRVLCNTGYYIIVIEYDIKALIN